MVTIKKSLFALALLGAAQLLWSNTVYQWTDENGVVHFSQSAPADKDQPAVETNLRSAAMTGGTFAPPKAETNEEPPEAEAAKEESQPTYKKDANACAEARQMLATLNTGRRLRLTDPESGEIFYATEEDLAEQRRRAEAQIERDC